MTDCLICFDDCEEKLSCCSQLAHAECVKEWLTYKVTCPHCRTKIGEEENVNKRLTVRESIFDWFTPSALSAMTNSPWFGISEPSYRNVEQNINTATVNSNTDTSASGLYPVMAYPTDNSTSDTLLTAAIGDAITGSTQNLYNYFQRTVTTESRTTINVERRGDVLGSIHLRIDPEIRQELPTGLEEQEASKKKKSVTKAGARVALKQKNKQHQRHLKRAQKSKNFRRR